MSLSRLIESKNTIFWDFDGVIKDSVDAKTEAYIGMFNHLSVNQKNCIIDHHTKNGGVSRFIKIPYYLEIAGLSTDEINIDIYLKRFASLVKCKVLTSPWVPGFKSFIEVNCKDKLNILTTATPLTEIIEILDCLSIKDFFAEIYGAPDSKSSSIKKCLLNRGLIKSECIMIGDSSSDLDAAIKCEIDFALRSTPYNTELVNKSTMYFENFYE